MARVALAPPFTDHAVIQRDRPISVRGSAAPGERVTVSFGAGSRTVKADRRGAWQVKFAAMAAGGPHKLTAAGADGSVSEANDILIGDVWLCSGQSNMEWPVANALNRDVELATADDAELRLLTIPQRIAMAPEARFADGVAWRRADRSSVGDFSAACYFMVRELRRSAKVPFGAIDASWGGTRIRSWMGDSAVRAIGDGEAADLLALYRRDSAAATRRFGETWGRWWRERSGDAPGTEPWQASERLSWHPIPMIGPWESWGDPAFADFNGYLWTRRKVTLTEAEAAGGATLVLGAIDELDHSWVNGVPVGSSYGWAFERAYRIAPGLLRAGENEIVVNVGDSWGFGGFIGPAEKLRLILGSGVSKPLSEGWEYSVVAEQIGAPPRAPWDSHAGAGVIHNAMIAPLRNYGLKGVAWYQGESDVGIPGYAARLSALMADWRRQFEIGGLPFLVVSLANFGPTSFVPVDSGWAQLRDQQRRAAAADARAAVVIAVDVGDRLELHPPNKQEVGRRLARAARTLAYGGSEPPSGPEIVRARRTSDAIVLEFRGVTGALRSWSSDRVLGIELCDRTQASCRYATAAAIGSTVRIVDDGRSANRVRYAWADSPIVNLYDDAMLPAGPFEVPIE
jgi:sialate O-acetylesterase